MGNALFVGGSAAFFIVYILMAEALGFLSESNIVPIGSPSGAEGDSGNYVQIWGFGFNLPDGLSPFVAAADLMGRFFQLLTFQAPGLEAASIVSLLVFVPLTFINGYIIFRAIRG